MRITRRSLLQAGAAGAVVGTLGARASRAQGQLLKTRFGFATKAVSPIIINAIIPEKLGYYAQEGLTVECIPMGSNAAVMAGAEAKRIEFAVGVPSFQLPLVAKGEKLPAINFFEYAYPFKWQMAVKPDSKLAALAELKGKKIGVSGFGQSDFPVGKALMALIGVDPEKDVTWLSVGEGVTAGQALVRSDIDALFYFDTGFGTIEAAGIELRYLPLPPNVPKTGGLYLSATPEMLREKRDWAVKFGRAIAKTQLFIQTNPEAAAYTFLQMYPEAAPKAKSVEEQVKAIMVPVTKRMPLYSHYDKSVTKWGWISAPEWQDEIKFAGVEGKIPDVSIFFTNALIDEINQFDPEPVRQHARQFKLPYKQA